MENEWSIIVPKESVGCYAIKHHACHSAFFSYVNSYTCYYCHEPFPDYIKLQLKLLYGK